MSRSDDSSILTDDTERSVFLPNIGDIVQRDGRLTKWTLTTANPTEDIWLQVLYAIHSKSFGASKMSYVVSSSDIPRVT